MDENIHNVNESNEEVKSAGDNKQVQEPVYSQMSLEYVAKQVNDAKRKGRFQGLLISLLVIIVITSIFMAIRITSMISDGSFYANTFGAYGSTVLDKKTIEKINKNVLRSSLAVVDQDIILFNDTIRENIRMWDKSIEDYEIILAARDAQIYDDIIKRPDGFDYVINENGSDLSGGQRQRLEIARTLAQDPMIVIMDEATSALDAVTEAKVVRSINDRGVSCIIVAHRLSTIRDCDEIIVMDKGEVVDRGTHEELMSRRGLYKEIVSSEDTVDGHIVKANS